MSQFGIMSSIKDSSNSPGPGNFFINTFKYHINFLNSTKVYYKKYLFLNKFYFI